MAYLIRYLRRAREEADHLRTTYGQEFAKAFDRWLVFLAHSAENGLDAASIDVLEVLEQIPEEGDDSLPNQWKYAWGRFKNASGLEMLRALLIVLKKRCPPWEFRMTSNWFSLLDCIAVEIQAYYVIDRPNKRVIFQLFDMDYQKHEHG